MSVGAKTALTSRGVLRGAMPKTEEEVEEAFDFSLAASDLSDLVLPGVSAAAWNRGKASQYHGKIP